jgi:hypothetical protein
MIRVFALLLLVAPACASSSTRTAAPTRDELRPADIKAGMASVRADVTHCNELHREPGFVEVKVAITGEGTVARAEVVGQRAGTPAARCVEQAVMHARFRSSGSPINVKYPFRFE